jgi:hypothetical protein
MNQTSADVKVFYYTECEKQQIENLAEHIRQNNIGTFLIKVWDKGSTIGLFKVK